MEMSIDEARREIISGKPYTDKFAMALVVAIDTMRKYEKIEQLIADYEEYKWERIDVKDIREIINGNDDRRN